MLTCTVCKIEFEAKESLKTKIELGYKGPFFCPTCFKAGYHVCAKCKTPFIASWAAAKKIKAGHHPFCEECWRSIYGGLPSVASGGAAVVTRKIEEGSPHKGVKKYRCEECGHSAMEHWIQLERAAGMKCPGCGSRRYGPVTDEAKFDIADKQEFRKSFPEGGDGHFVTS